MKSFNNCVSICRRYSNCTLHSSHKKTNFNYRVIDNNAVSAHHALCYQMRNYVELRNNVKGARAKKEDKSKENHSCNTVKPAPFAEWRVFMTKEQIERVDLLTYWLKRYPETINEQHVKEMQSRKLSTKAMKLDKMSKLSAKSYSLHSSCSATPSRDNDLQQKSQTISYSCNTSSNLNLSSKLFSFPLSLSLSSLSSSSLAARNSTHDNNNNNSCCSNKNSMCASTNEPKGNVPSRPFTSFTDVVKLASVAEQEWTDEELETRIYEEEENKERSRLTTHPATLFTDEDAILNRFGMGEYVSPSVKGFTGLFRQNWHDFHVTEMINDLKSECGGIALSRVYSFDIPSVPSWLIDTCNKINLQATHLTEAVDETHWHNNMEHLENHADDAINCTAQDTEKVDQSFFMVDAKQRVNEMRSETIAEEDLIAAREAIAGTNEKYKTVQFSLINESKTTINSRTKESVDTKKTSNINKNVMEDNVNTTNYKQSSNTNSSSFVNHDDNNIIEGKLLTNVIARIHALSDKEEELVRASNALTKEGNSQKLDVNGILENNINSVDRVKISETSNKRSQSHSFYLQCTLHKEHVAHSVALSNIAQVLRIHPQAISVSGIKDYIGDTVQRIRLKKVSPYAANLANTVFHSKECHITLSNFTYERVPLVAGDHFGNHFHIVLRDVVASPKIIHDAMTAFHTFGFPNYYGCQRFSWFGGINDAAFAMLRNDWLVFAFTFLNYTNDARSLRELLQRQHKYPHAVQDEYRRNIVRRLRRVAIEPTDLDQWPFLSCPPLGESVELINNAEAKHGIKLELILHQLKEAYFDLSLSSRRLIAQKLSSYLWNQVLSLRLHHFGGREVLCGDLVASAAMRQLSHTPQDRKEWYSVYKNVVTEHNKHLYHIQDVVHPGFSFNDIVLPENAIGCYYHQICDKYYLDWSARHSTTGLIDFMEPPRPIIRFPIDLRYSYDESSAILSIDFALERGCYANVALTELLKATRCVGSEKIMCVPVPSSMWDGLGQADRGYVDSFQDIYEGYEDGEGFVNDTETIAFHPDSEMKVWDYQGPLFMPDEDDPFVKAQEWGEKNLLRNMQRRIADVERMKSELFEEPLAKQISDEELSRYAGYMVPLPPNVSGKKVFHKVLRRRRRYAGAPKITPRVKMGAPPIKRQPRTKPFKTLNRDSWNVMW